ncbi:hypothetical protein L1887_40148 [Cichorium endivia]|nr:hypothetical protein L1887_40148 [Cichorium endivia]
MGQHRFQLLTSCVPLYPSSLYLAPTTAVQATPPVRHQRRSLQFNPSRRRPSSSVHFPSGVLHQHAG